MEPTVGPISGKTGPVSAKRSVGQMAGINLAGQKWIKTAQTREIALSGLCWSMES